MPSVSKKQADFMRAVAHSPEFAKKAGVPQSVGKEFSNADKSRKFSKGGDMKHEDVKMDKKMMQKAVNKHEGRLHKGAAMTKLAKGGSAKYMSFDSSGKPSGMKAVKTSPSRDGIATKGKTKGTMIKMNYGGKC